MWASGRRGSLTKTLDVYKRQVYDSALAAYGMLHADGTPQLDANTGTQAAFDNLLILYSCLLYTSRCV